MHDKSPFTKEGDIAGSAHNRDHPITTTFDQEKYDIGNGQHTFMNKQQEFKLNHASQKVMTRMTCKEMHLDT